ncbi:hypothetical protein NEMBOFW57_002258 [Staphylotrichum longicolle]|uniref:Uncharacterized protein n=1 Tax=Staphylotrichum longicolle TaxID=669026 RepID=A0AAD4F7N9_9PEZI|nr:hypothetical protein NEMBOFW57_002258 [Staphylotrichum longicolle]
MPGLTIATDAHPASAPTAPRPIANPRRASASSRTSPPSSPSRPPVSPITPMLGPTQLPGAGATGPGTSSTTATTTTTTQSIPDFALGRPTFTHMTQTDQVGVAPPPAQPIDFDSNPDVLALKSAISILQLQRARATADIQSLSRARDAALGNPASFVADLQAGKVRNLPKPQTVVRCPPINWAQYGVVGDSLDKLHAEQLAAHPGAPAVLGPGGTYEFKAGDRSTGGAGAGAGPGVGSQRDGWSGLRRRTTL